MKRALPVILAVLLSCPPASAQWFEEAFPSTEYIWGIRFADMAHGWVFGQDFIYGTSDGGATWVVQDTSLGPSEAFYALDTATAFYSNYTGFETNGIRRTTNGGGTWETVDSAGVFYVDFDFVTGGVGFVGGATLPEGNSILRKTTDGGETWFTVSTIDHDVFDEFEGISFLSESLGWAITYMGSIYRTDDGGLTWMTQDSATDVQNMRDIQFTTPDSGWAVGGIAGDMRIWRTTDGGSTWIKQTLAGSSLREIQMMNSQTGWFVGRNNGPPFIAKTSDGGVSWVGQESIPSVGDGFESFSMINDTVGWSAGSSGRLYKTTDGGVTWVQPGELAPTEFVLSQNYPNPFNPTTTFSFSIPYTSIVNLTVFNLLGEEVATLVSGQMNAGTHTVQWDATGQPSGVYFYRLQSGNKDGGQREFVETKKLILMR